MPIAAPIVAAILLLVALAPLPYNGYMLIRAVATVVLVWAAVTAVGRRKQVLAVALVFFALVLNPLIKLRCRLRPAWRSIWVECCRLRLSVSPQVLGAYDAKLPLDSNVAWK